MNPVVSILLELAASEFWNGLKGRFAAPMAEWQDQLVERLGLDSGLALSDSERSAVRAWISRPEVFEVLAASTIESVTEDAARISAALQYQLGAPSEERVTRADVLVARTIEHLAVLVEPAIAATVATFRSLKRDSHALMQGQRVLLDKIEAVEDAVRAAFATGETELDRSLLEGVPLVVEIELRAALNECSRAGLLLQHLSGGTDARARVANLIEQPPEWLASCSMWTACGHMADALGLAHEAVLAFAFASELDPTRRPVLLARAALSASGISGDDRALGFVERARAGATSADVIFIDVVDAVVRQDTSVIVSGVDPTKARSGAERVLVTNVLGQALTMTGSLDSAIDVFDSAVAAADRQAGYLLTYANACLARATAENSRTRTADAGRALQLAIKARDERRRWGGNSAECTAAACKAAFLLMDPDELIRLADPVAGNATTEEAEYTEVKQLLAFARAVSGGDLPDPTSPFERAWFRGLRLSAEPGQRSQAISDLREAAALAADEIELDRAHRSLANLGVEDLPRLEEVRLRSPDHADCLRALARIVVGDLAGATALLRPTAGRNGYAALLLADIHRQRGELDVAGSLLFQTGTKLDDPFILSLAVDTLARAGRIDDASRAANLVIPLTAVGSDDRRRTRWLMAKIATSRNDALAIEAACRTAIDEGEDDPAIRWLRVEALLALHRRADAWREIQRPPALPAQTEDRARLYLQILMREAPKRLELLVDMLERFPTSHDVQATGLMLWLAIDTDAPADEMAVRTLQSLLDRFVASYPDSPALRAQTVTPDEPDVLREQLRAMLGTDPERDQTLKQLAHRAEEGLLPTGFLGALVGRQYLHVMLAGTTLAFPSIPRDEGLLREQAAAVLINLDHPVVLDTSSLVAVSFLPGLWPSLLGAFSAVTMTAAQFAEIDDSVFVKPASGYMSWDHVNDTLRLVDVDEHETSAFRARRELIRTWASELPKERAEVLPDQFTELLADDVDGTWVSAIALALARNCGLICDDVGLAGLARSMGVPTFSSFALVMALEHTGRLADDVIGDFAQRLFMAHAWDIPLTADGRVALAEDLGWPEGPLLSTLRRTALWSDLQAASQFFGSALRRPGITPLEAGRILAAAAVGLSNSVIEQARNPLVARLCALAIVITQEPEAVPPLVAAVREVAHTWATDYDPLSSCAAATLQAFQLLATPDAAARRTVLLFSELSEEDRATVRTTIFE